MNIFTSTNQAICSVMGTLTDVASATGKTVSMATTYVDNRAISQKLTDTQSVMLHTAKHMKDIQAELDADDELAAQFLALHESFGLPAPK